VPEQHDYADDAVEHEADPHDRHRPVAPPLNRGHGDGRHHGEGGHLGVEHGGRRADDGQREHVRDEPAAGGGSWAVSRAVAARVMPIPATCAMS